MISILSVIDPTHGHLEGVCPAATAHGHLRHIVNIIRLIFIVLLVEEASPTQSIYISTISQEMLGNILPRLQAGRSIKGPPIRRK